MLSSKSFLVSGLTFRSLIHSEFIFLYGVRKYYNFILLHVAVQFSQYHSLKRLSLLHCIFLPPLSTYKLPIGVWVHFWAFYLVPLVYGSVFVPVPYCLVCSVVCVKSLSRVRLFAIPWTPLSMEFSRQEYWSGLPFPSLGDLPNPGVEPRIPALQADALSSEAPGKS